MPISRHCHPQVIKQYNFRWIPKGMIYLGIKLTSELGEMATLNFEPLLQNIKTNLGKWGKLNLKMGTFLHLIWECPLVEPFWHSVLKFLETWAGVALPVSPRLCLLGDKTETPTLTKRACPVLTVGITTIETSRDCKFKIQTRFEFVSRRGDIY
uniref:Uncharacterized protein n=1 Tax=Pygocentrus nattereri TaxID=42514 RepID=A0AAR2LRZ1_PYGNA